MMLDAVFAFAVALGGVAALLGSRTALALLCGTFVDKALTVLGVPFDPNLWMAVDLMVMAAIGINAILRLALDRTDKVVLALFLPAWWFYYIDGWNGYAGSVAVCSSQFLLVFPWGKAWRRAKETPLPPDPFEDFDLRVRA
jgi:hypothetical protein